MKSKPEIGILGCGWLGKAVAKVLIEKGYKLKGSTTTSDGLQALLDLGVQPFVIHLKPQRPISNLESFLSGLQALIIAIPPKFRQDENQLLNAFKMMFENYDFSHLEKLIYVSSTGVFEDGIDVYYDEDSIPNNTSKRGKNLIDLEEIIVGQNQVKSSILRYGGLIKKGGRHPIHYLSGKKDIPNPDAPVNLIEQSDAVNLLCKIIESSTQLKIYHGVYPSHPSRKEYYNRKSEELNLPPPEFISSKTSIGKTILSEKTRADLSFEFMSFPNRSSRNL